MSTILLWRDLNTRHMKLHKIMYRESWFTDVFLLLNNSDFKKILQYAKCILEDFLTTIRKFTQSNKVEL